MSRSRDLPRIAADLLVGEAAEREETRAAPGSCLVRQATLTKETHGRYLGAFHASQLTSGLGQGARFVEQGRVLGE